MFMDISSALKFIVKVEPSSRVNILLKLNDGYSLMVEGGFSVNRKSEELVQ